jgi:hypothetical protein
MLLRCILAPKYPLDWRHIQPGGLQGDTKDWSTSPNFNQWQEHQTAKAIPSPEARELIRSLIYEPPQGFKWYGTN